MYYDNFIQMQSHMYLKSHGDCKAFLLECKNRKFFVYEVIFFNLDSFREGRLRRDRILCNAQLYFSLHIHTWRASPDGHTHFIIGLYGTILVLVPCSRVPQ